MIFSDIFAVNSVSQFGFWCTVEEVAEGDGEEVAITEGDVEGEGTGDGGGEDTRLLSISSSSSEAIA